MSLVGDILSPVAGIGSTILNYGAQQSANRTNLQIARDNRDFYYQQWQRENAYNDPSSQMERLARAGLNPNLMYGEGAGGLAASATMQNVDTGRVVAPQVDPLMLAQIANINADTKQKNAQTDSVKESTQSIVLDNFFKSFEKNIMENNKDAIESAAVQSVAAGRMRSVNEYYQAAYSAAIVAALFGMDEGNTYQFGENSVTEYSVGGLYYDEQLHEKFKQLGLGDLEQRRLEQALYKSFYDAQSKVNKRSGETAQMQTVIPEMINGAPDWLKPILVLLNSWFNEGNFSPSFSPRSTSISNTSNNENNFDRMMFFGRDKK